MKFSERHGYQPIRDSIQIESMDEALRNGLWNRLQLFCWDHAQFTLRIVRRTAYFDDPKNEPLHVLCKRIWVHLFKRPLDEMDEEFPSVLRELRENFFSFSWDEVYDFIEFVADNYPGFDATEDFRGACNNVLEEEMSAYRFVSGKITPITDEQELGEIEQGIEESPGPVRQHLHRSLELLSDRSSPDYRNSIKESISAVESLVAIKLEEEGGTLGQLLKKLDEEVGLHPALKSAFSSLYGYTSDEGGIRHALIEQEKQDFSDAKFMLVVCSAFINFVKGKSQK